MQRMGADSAPGFMDLGTTTIPTADYRPDLPLFRLTCRRDVRPHPYLGRVVYTFDPGKALITGRCRDIGSINMQQFRGLAARAPYFANGSAETLRDVVDFYDRRFTIGYSEQDKQDLVNFMSVL
jgi:cytochrome c peroxidase